MTLGIVEVVVVGARVVLVVDRVVLGAGRVESGVRAAPDACEFEPAAKMPAAPPAMTINAINVPIARRRHRPRRSASLVARSAAYAASPSEVTSSAGFE